MAGSPLNDARRPWGCLGCLGVVVLVLVVIGAVKAVEHLRGPSEVSDPTVEFAERQEPATTTEQAAPADAQDSYDDGADWPMYGGNAQRTRYLPFATRGTTIRPPLTEKWGNTGKVLLEFPPVLCGRRLYVLRNDALLRAIDRRTGRTAWQKRVGRLAASSPACADGRIYATVLKRNRFDGGGQIIALRARNGARIWRVTLGSRTESSPLIAGDRVIFGTEKGEVLALHRVSGRVLWRYRASGAVKAAVAMEGNTLYVGDYGGRMHAIWARSGKRRWTADLGGSLYSTPAVAYGRVFVGNIDRSVVALGAQTGRIAWRRRAKGYVYSAPAVAPVRGKGPTVFIGSYGGQLLALDARSGRTRWSRELGGRISGGITVVGDLVMYANLGRKSLGIRGASTGDLVYSHRSGAFDPGISDGRRLYINTYTSVYHLVPKAQAAKDRRSLRRAKQARRDQRATRRASASASDVKPAAGD
jgi:outer membrane protein assembly factor BamB